LAAALIGTNVLSPGSAPANQFAELREIFPIPEEGRGDESLMSPKAHGTTATEVQKNLRFGVDRKLADKICSYNRRYAENYGSFTKTSFQKDFLAMVEKGPVTFYDSVTGKPLFRAPVGRSVDDFIAESRFHGWPSFRDEEVVWSNVRVLNGDGEAVSADGTHLGHNIPDSTGNRYCINLVSVSGQPV
jgi:peptide methionine sulfoxide reductase MsrB